MSAIPTSRSLTIGPLGRTIIIVFVFLSTLGAAGVERVSREYQLKGAFLYKFLNFVEWGSNNSSTKRLCVLGDNPFGDILEQLVAVHDPEFKGTEVLKFSAEDQLHKCNIVFISRSKGEEISKLLDIARVLPLVTVSDVNGFALKGGLIEFTLQDDRIRFIINQRQAKAQGIVFSSQLLSLATTVISD